MKDTERLQKPPVSALLPPKPPAVVSATSKKADDLSDCKILRDAFGDEIRKSSTFDLTASALPRTASWAATQKPTGLASLPPNPHMRSASNSTAYPPFASSSTSTRHNVPPPKQPRVVTAPIAEPIINKKNSRDTPTTVISSTKGKETASGPASREGSRPTTPKLKEKAVSRSTPILAPAVVSVKKSAAVESTESEGDALEDVDAALDMPSVETPLEEDPPLIPASAPFSSQSISDSTQNPNAHNNSLHFPAPLAAPPGLSPIPLSSLPSSTPHPPHHISTSSSYNPPSQIQALTDEIVARREAPVPPQYVAQPFADFDRIFSSFGDGQFGFEFKVSLETKKGSRLVAGGQNQGQGQEYGEKRDHDASGRGAGVGGFGRAGDKVYRGSFDPFGDGPSNSTNASSDGETSNGQIKKSRFDFARAGSIGNASGTRGAPSPLGLAAGLPTGIEGSRSASRDSASYDHLGVSDRQRQQQALLQQHHSLQQHRSISASDNNNNNSFLSSGLTQTQTQPSSFDTSSYLWSSSRDLSHRSQTPTSTSNATPPPQQQTQMRPPGLGLGSNGVHGRQSSYSGHAQQQPPPGLGFPKPSSPAGFAGGWANANSSGGYGQQGGQGQGGGYGTSSGGYGGMGMGYGTLGSNGMLRNLI